MLRDCICLLPRDAARARVVYIMRMVCLMLGIGVVLMAAGACAQDEPAGTPGGAELAELSLESLLDVRVTTASKKSETMGESPAAVYVVDSTDIYRYGYRTLADALRSIVGLYTSSDREFDYLGVRGYSRSGDYNGRVLLLVDGHRVNDPIFGTATVGEDCPVDMQDVERIEVVKGPGSSLWGTNALLATVNIITRNGRDTGGMRLATDGERQHAEYGGALGDGWDVVCSATGLESDGQDKIYFPEFDSPETNNGVAENLDGTKATRVRIAASRKGLRLAYGRGMRIKSLSTAPFGTIFNDPDTRTSDDRRHLELSYDSQEANPSGHSIYARVFSDQYFYTGYYPYDDPAPKTINRDDDVARWWGAELRRSDDLTDDLSVVCGVEYQRTGRATQRCQDLDPYYEYYYFSDTQSAHSYYAQAAYNPSELMHFTLGTRYDHYSSFGSNWSPRAALVYSLSRDTNIKLLYGNAFRAPNFYEMSWNDVGVPILQPEKMRTQEFVWEQRLDTNSRLTASLFKFEVNDIITYETTEENGSYMTNRGAVRSGGFEMQYENRSSYGTRGYLGLCVSRTTASDSEVTNSPNWVLTGGASIPVLGHKYWVSPQIRTTGRVFTTAGDRLGARTDVDLVVTTAAHSSGTNVSVGVYNLLGTNSFAPGPSGRTQDKIPQAERALRVMVSRGF